MADSGPREEAAPAGARATALDRIASFRFIYVAIFAFALLYVLSLGAAEWALNLYFRSAVAAATRVSPAGGPIADQIQENIGDLLRDSPWIRIGGVRVNAFVLGADARTPLYVGGRGVPPPTPYSTPDEALREAMRLLPATAEVVVSVPPDSVLATGILIAYATVLLQTLFVYNRRVARRAAELLDAAVAARADSAARARDIEAELELVRRRLAEVEPSERAHSDEIRKLQIERQALQRKLSELAERESELRASASRSLDLQQEHQALEDLLEEALEDVGRKEEEIQSLQDRLKRAARTPPATRGRASEHLARRMRTLYKDLEVDDRAIQDMLALGDEATRLKAEEGLKRLNDDPESAAVRRKVGGLPPQQSIFELGFAGKGRIYYARGRQRRYRVLLIGAKNTQKPDLEYLSRVEL